MASETYAFELRINVTANAQTMVMFENKTVDVGSLDGLRAYTFDVLNGERDVTYNVLFTPPSSEWSEATVRFHTYSHCLVGANCAAKLERNLTWTFVNNPPPSPDQTPTTSTKEPAKSPGPLLVPALVVLLGLAITRKRRR